MPNTEQSRTLYVLYHELQPGLLAYTYGMETARFAEHVRLFAAMKTAGRTLQPEMTFDDGHRSNYEEALPVLQQNGQTAWFFITAGWIGDRAGYMDWSELRALEQAGNRIGAHGWSHTLLTHCSATELQKELRDTRLLLEDKLGVAVNAMSFPGGRYNKRVLEACYNAGYTKMFTSRPEVSMPSQTGLIGRLNLRRDVTAEWLTRLFAKDENLFRILKRQHNIKAFAKRLLGDTLYAAVWRFGNHAGVETQDNIHQ